MATADAKSAADAGVVPRRGLVSLKRVGMPARSPAKAVRTPIDPSEDDDNNYDSPATMRENTLTSSGIAQSNSRPSTPGQSSRSSSAASLVRPMSAVSLKAAHERSASALLLARPPSQGATSRPPTSQSARTAPAAPPAHVVTHSERSSSRASSKRSTPASSAPSSPKTVHVSTRLPTTVIARSVKSVTSPSSAKSGKTETGARVTAAPKAGLQKLATVRTQPKTTLRAPVTATMASRSARPERGELSNGPFDVLPDEIVVQILSLLGCDALLNLSLVSRRLSRLASDPQLWKKHCVRRWGAGVAWISRLQDEAAAAKWKRAYLSHIARQRSHWVSTQCTKASPYTGLPKAASLLTALRVRWELKIIDIDGRATVLPADEATDHTLSTAVRWRTGIPADMRLTNVASIEVYALVPLLADPMAQQRAPVKSGTKGISSSSPAALDTRVVAAESTAAVPVRRSLLCAVDGASRVGIENVCRPLASEGSATVFVVDGSCFIVGCWSSGGGIAFVTANLHHDGLVELVLRGNDKNVYLRPSHAPIHDDVDPSYGLHDYAFVVEVRSEKKGRWSNRFDGIHFRGGEDSSSSAARAIKLMSNGTDQPVSSGAKITKRKTSASSSSPGASASASLDDLVADFVVLEEGGTSHAFTGRPSTACKSEAFEHVLENVVIIDFVLLDEHKHIAWSESRMVALDCAGEDDVSYVYSGGRQYSAVVADPRHGSVCLKLVRFQKDNRVIIGSVEFSLKLKFLKEWFGLCK